MTNLTKLGPIGPMGPGISSGSVPFFEPLPSAHPDRTLKAESVDRVEDSDEDSDDDAVWISSSSPVTQSASQTNGVQLRVRDSSLETKKSEISLHQLRGKPLTSKQSPSESKKTKLVSKQLFGAPSKHSASVHSPQSSAPKAASASSASKPKSRFFGTPDDSPEGSPFSSPESTPVKAKAVSASKPKSRFFGTPDGSPEKSPFSSPDSTPVKAATGAGPGAGAVQTPQQVRKAVALLNAHSPSRELTLKERQQIKSAMQQLHQMGASPSRKEKAVEIGKRAKTVVSAKLTKGAIPDSLAYHGNGVAGVESASRSYKAEVIHTLPSLPGAGAAPLRFVNAPHVTSAAKKGNTIIGLHYISKEDFDKAHICSFESVNPSNGVVGRYFSLKADAGKKDAPTKFSSIFPEGCCSGFEELAKMAVVAPRIARQENRELVMLQFKDRVLYAETYLRERGTIIHDIFPLYSYFEFVKDGSCQITKDLTLSAEQVLKLTAAALEKVNPYVVDQDCPVRYIIKKGAEVDLIVDLATQLKETHIPHGIMVRISSKAFDGNPDLAGHVADIVQTWD